MKTKRDSQPRDGLVYEPRNRLVPAVARMSPIARKEVAPRGAVRQHRAFPRSGGLIRSSKQSKNVDWGLRQDLLGRLRGEADQLREDFIHDGLIKIVGIGSQHGRRHATR